MGAVRINTRLTLLILAVSASLAAETASVDRLRELIGTAAAKHTPDRSTTRRIAVVELTERLTEDTLAELQSRAPGPQTAAKLAELADQSAFLDPPSTERAQGERPTLADQKQIFSRAAAYTLDYAKRLPNLICDETIRRFDNLINLDPEAETLGELHHRDTVVVEVTYSGSNETASIKAVKGGRRALSGTLSGFSSSGEFGNILIAPFFPNSHAKASWSHWETLHGKRIAVFRYTVPLEGSRYQVSYCCLGNKPEQSIVAGYREFLFIDPEEGTIVRITRSSTGLPGDFPTRQVDAEVEYGPVSIGGQSFMAPIRSVTKADNTPPTSTQVTRTFGGGNNNERLHSLNETRFAGYRKFAAEGRLVTDEAAPAEGKPGFVAPDVPLDNAREAREPLPDAPNMGEAKSQAVPSIFALPQLPPFHELPMKDADPLPATLSFRDLVHVVRVPMVVRNRKGETVSDLNQAEVEVFDNGKKQTITSFEVQRAAASRTGTQDAPGLKTAAAQPGRYTAYVFDDVRLSFGDLSQTRSAEARLLRELLEPGTRIGVFTTSGQTTLDFTSDREQIAAALNKIGPNRVAGAPTNCPNPGAYLSDLIINQSDPAALQSAVQEAMDKCNAHDRKEATTKAMGAARQSLAFHEYEARVTLSVLQLVVARLAGMPGERSLVLVSPGFFTSVALPGVDAVEERAVRGDIAINTLDARGLYTIAGFDADQTGKPNEYARQEQREQSGVLAHLADATGGRMFENSNDYDAGFRMLSKRPDITYLIGFKPRDEKADGSYHRLKVKVNAGKGLQVQARRGYVAPTKDAEALR